MNTLRNLLTNCRVFLSLRTGMRHRQQDALHSSYKPRRNKAVRHSKEARIFLNIKPLSEKAFRTPTAII